MKITYKIFATVIECVENILRQLLTASSRRNKYVNSIEPVI